MKYRLATLLFVTCVLAVSAAYGDLVGISNFAVSSDTYSVYSDVETIIDSLFGEQYRLADWTDILAYHDQGNDMQAFADMIPSRTMLSYHGDRFWTADRHYFINISNHNTPAGFLVHGQIDNHLIDLGSWWNPRRILAYTDAPAVTVPVPGAFLLGALGLGFARWRLKKCGTS